MADYTVAQGSDSYWKTESQGSRWEGQELDQGPASLKDWLHTDPHLARIQ